MNPPFPEMAHEWPEFDQSTLPPIPAGWEESSWRNDLCPSFRDLESGLQIWIEEADPEKREFPEEARYGLTSLVPEFERPDWHFKSDDWSEVLDAVAGRDGMTSYDVRAWRVGRILADHFAKGMGTEELADAVDQMDRVGWQDLPALLQRWGVLSLAYPFCDEFGAPSSVDGPSCVRTEDVAYAIRGYARFIE